MSIVFVQVQSTLKTPTHMSAAFNDMVEITVLLKARGFESVGDPEFKPQSHSLVIEQSFMKKEGGK